MRAHVTTLSFTILFSGIAHADTLNVPLEYPTIQSAIDEAQVGDVVLVAPGNYVEAISFLGKNITVVSAEGPVVTGIKPPLGTGTPTVTFAAKESPTAVLSGFAIGGGFGGPIIDPVFGACFAGGGIYCFESSPEISNCRMIGNSGGGSSSVPGHGGGMVIVRGNPTVRHCEFLQNSASGHGGAIYIIGGSQATIDGCVFTNNSASWGGAITCTMNVSAMFTDCVFTGNEVINVGGAMYIRSSSSPILDGCDFIGNIQEGNPTAGGGAVTMYGSGNGGGPCYPVFTDCEFIENSAQGYGGAVHAAYSGSPTMIDCQFTLNTSTAGGGAIATLGHIKAPTTVEIQDSIIEFNQTDGNGAGLDARMSTVLLSNVSIMGNDAGMSGGGCSFNSSETSILINSTICGNSPDQTFGVFNDNGGNTITDRCIKCEGDLTGDGSVDSADVGLLLADWNQDGPADLNGDSVVNSADLGLLLVKWGPC